MNASVMTDGTLVAHIWPSRTSRGPWSGVLRAFALASVGALLIWWAAKIQVPFYPVPMTMQTLVVLALGMAYGWRLGVSTLLLYLGLGAVGLPVFAGTPDKGIGLAYMAGPTGGYLVGYVAAVAACGWLAERGWDRNVWTAVVAMLVGNVLIYVPGLLWLGALLGWDKPILAWGLTPFVLGDLAKVALGGALLPGVWRMLGRRGARRPEDA